MKHRVACVTCGTHVDLNAGDRCSCGSSAFKTVTPTAGDIAAVEQDILEAAMAMDRALLAGAVVTRSHNAARRLAAACRELALTRAGVVCR
jgi:hypothetical protein